MTLSTALLDRFEKQQKEARKWAWVHEGKKEPSATAPATSTTETPVRPPTQNKTVVRIGDKIERTTERKEKRAQQVLAVLRAFINAPTGFTDQELVARRIGGSDGPRRRRTIREKLGVSFTVTPDAETGCTRWSLTDPDHARKVLVTGMPVAEE